MNINSAKLVYFSPTKTTKAIVEGIAQGMHVSAIEEIDLTPPEAATQQFEEMHDGLAVIGVPVYGGRVPLDAVSRLQRLKANETPAVFVVVYGNRAYEDALLELKDLVTCAGFRPFAGGAFIGEHSFANETTPIAIGRPNVADLKKATEFGKLIRKKMSDRVGLPTIELSDSGICLNTAVCEFEKNLIEAEFISKIFRFVDDVDFHLDETEKVIHVRSASRVGFSDLGTNRRRIEKIRKLFNENEEDFS